MGNNVLKISSVDKGKGFSKISFKILFLTMVIVSLFACFSLANVAPKPNFKVSLVNASGALKPIASFTYSPSSPLAGQNTTFDGSGSSDPLGIITSYDWTFGDGGTGSGKIVTHQHADKGQYNVALTITDILSNTDTKHSIISAHGKPPIAQFTASQTTVDTGISIQFDASSSHDPDGTITGYQWTFGDGATATGVTTSHSYTTAGSYTVQLTVTDNDGSTNSCQNTITIHDRPPIAQFSASSRTVYTNVNIQFDASASYDPDGTITTYSWNFGDGNTAIGVTTSHSYYSASVYTVTLTVTDNYGSTGSSQTTITVQNRPQNQPPTARFTASNTTVETGSTVSLDASGSHDSDGTITNYQWNFGDGATSSGITTSHAYIENGTYTITLTVTDNGGLTNSIQTTITVEDRKPIAAFTTSADTVTTEVPVEFNASNSFDPDGTIVSFQWNFGDGNTSSGQTVTHSYIDNGNYTVTLTVADNDGSTNNTTTLITVLDQPPTASFTISSETVLINQQISFDASTSFDPDGTIVSYFWNFDDGINSTDAITSHSYSSNGTYAVTLTVTDDDGSIGTNTTIVHVHSSMQEDQAPIANFTESSETRFTGETISFNASESYDPDGTITNYDWNFGDNSTGTGIAIDHIFDVNGVFLVQLTVVDNEGLSGSSNTTITILDRPPNASFTPSSTLVFTGDTVHFNATVSYDLDGTIISYVWDFGDGTNATDSIANHAYDHPGNYTVALTISDDDGSTDGTSVTVTVLNGSPTASFTISPEQLSPNETIFFNASSSFTPTGTIIRYNWDFGDGNMTDTSSDTISHIYNEPGNFTISLTIFNQRNSNDSMTQLISLNLHSVTLLAVNISSRQVQAGQVVNFTVQARNKGTAPESFNVTLYGNETEIGTIVFLNLPAGTEDASAFMWNTSSVSGSSDFLIRAVADNLTGELEFEQNTLEAGVVRITSNGNNLNSVQTPSWIWVFLTIPAAALPLAMFLLKKKSGRKNSRGMDYFDEVIGGGIPDSFSVLIKGAAGAGKSILCQELAYSFLGKQKPCLYITYDCFPNEVRENLKGFGQSTAELEKIKQLLFVDCYASTAKTKSVEEYSVSQPFSLPDLGITLSEATGEIGKSPLVILDSIVPLLAHIDPSKVLDFLQDRSARIKGLNGVFVVSIGEETIDQKLMNRLEETVDCLIEVDMVENKGASLRQLRVRKMRGRKASDAIIQFTINPEKGIVFSV